MAGVTKILTGQAYIHYSDLSLSQSCVCVLMSFTLYLVSCNLSGALYICALLTKTTLKHCEHIFTGLVPVCMVSQLPSRLPELSPAVMRVYRDLLPLTPTEALPQKARERNKLQVHWNLTRWRPLCYSRVYENQRYFFLCWAARF